MLICQSRIKNIESIDAEEVVQVYLSMENPKEQMPLSTLVNFQRIAINKGDYGKVSFSIPYHDFAYYNSHGQKIQHKGKARTIESKEESPNLMFRAIKFNLPWDSYRRSPALDLHYETCRDTFFWKSFLDMMVENRFNKLTLWNLHPFSYMVKTEKYPEG